MTPERWRQIDQLFHSALEREPEGRAAFLDQACGGDEALRREVESLLAADAEIDKTIIALPAQVAAEMFEEDQVQQINVRQIGHYRIMSQLGAGGMGEVYLAQDTKLGRKIALKLLPVRFTQLCERVRRVDQESRAASALNHPNIITIHEIGETEGMHYLITEYIEGETLRRRMARERMAASAALDVAIQIASALAAAHAAGIVHRDIKPENVMVRNDGIVKVLDFGLAKLTEHQLPAPQPTGIDMQVSTVAASSTSTGMVMGTASYMSPEQARGLKVDARSDIFSFGVVLYEMLAGKRPFVGATAGDTIAAILRDEPQALSQYLSDCPISLERSVNKCLAKSLDQRHQTAGELSAELKATRATIEKLNGETRAMVE